MATETARIAEERTTQVAGFASARKRAVRASPALRMGEALEVESQVINLAQPVHATVALRQMRAEAPTEAPPAAQPMVGLALSGGGIRSATFGLGVLQALAASRKLESFDYLSTVSGGGYIGSWLSAWIHRSGLDDVQTRLGEFGSLSSKGVANIGGTQ